MQGSAKKPNQDLLADDSDVPGGTSATPRTESQRNTMRAKNLGFSEQMSATEEAKLSYEGKGALAQMQSAISG